MEQNEKVKKEKKKINLALRIIGDVIFVPITIFVLVATIILFNAKNNNEVPSLFGYSVVKILTPSMSNKTDDQGNKVPQPEFAAGQCVVVKAVDTKELEVGDIIAFYKLKPDADVETGGSTTASISSSSASIVGGARNSTQKRVAKYSEVIFHRIVAIAPDPEGSDLRFFQTKGDNNELADQDAAKPEDWVREDYVVGEYVSTNSFVCSIFNFCTSTVGSIVLIIVPCAVLIIILGYNIAVEYKGIKNENEFENLENKKQKEILSEVTNDKKHQSKKKKEKEAKMQKEKEKMLDEILADNNQKEEAKGTVAETKQEESKPNENAKEPPIPTQPKKPPVPPKRPPAPPKK